MKEIVKKKKKAEGFWKIKGSVKNKEKNPYINDMHKIELFGSIDKPRVQSVKKRLTDNKCQGKASRIEGTF